MRIRLVIILALVCAVVGLVYVASRNSRTAANTPIVSTNNGSASKTLSSFRRSASVRQAVDDLGESSTSATTSNLIQRLLAGDEDTKLTREQLAEYLRQYGTNVETLLATQDRDHLKLAAELFPNDPRVQYAVVARDIFPEARREWLDRFKASAPDNALASYLSAREYLRAGDREQGLKDLAEGARRPHYNDYSLEQVQNMEDAQLSAGRTIAEAKVAAGGGLLLPQLAMLKGLSQDMQKMQKEYIAAGDTGSAEALAQMGRSLAQQLTTGEGSRVLINQLVGAAIERIVLSPLGTDYQPAFLNGTVQQRFDELQTFRQSVRDLTQGFEPWMANASETELISYFDRMKIQGEYKALLWLRNRQNLR